MLSVVPVCSQNFSFHSKNSSFEWILIRKNTSVSEDLSSLVLNPSISGGCNYEKKKIIIMIRKLLRTNHFACYILISIKASALIQNFSDLFSDMSIVWLNSSMPKGIHETFYLKVIGPFWIQIYFKIKFELRYLIFLQVQNSLITPSHILQIIWD